MLGLSKKEKAINNLLNKGMCSPDRQMKIGEEIVKILNSSTEKVSFNCTQGINKMALAFDPSPAVDFMLNLMSSPYFVVYKNSFMFASPKEKRVCTPSWKKLAVKYAGAIVSVLCYSEEPNYYHAPATGAWKNLINAAKA